MKRIIKKEATENFKEYYNNWNTLPFNEKLLGKKLTAKQSEDIDNYVIHITIGGEKYHICRSMTEPILNHKIEHYV